MHRSDQKRLLRWSEVAAHRTDLFSQSASIDYILFGIRQDGGVSLSQKGPCRLVDMLRLIVPVRMMCAFFRLAIALETATAAPIVH
jgi:hypothetical protein